MIFRNNKEVLGTSGVKATLNEGEYEAIIKRIIYLRDCKTDWGFRDFLEVIYNISVGVTEQEKKEKIMVSQAEKSKCFNFLMDVYNGNIPNEINIDELAGKKCTLTIKHNTDEKGNVYANIVERKFN
ncbi:hypothetical protein EHZ13_01340 [Clostridium perfringens]|jgi:hypothetical protein|uniref:hypothetical protein n=1 Tax=Clostridium TaxID=1485 RepID=UPI000F52B333|nr:MULTISPECIES: hypothetical protein [Clostridium]MDB2107880.1 hypothetical protein [Clostridium paraputrificum]MDB2114822.1 hypothetical protein [Clostridium paraputrificum]MDK3119943.1 hypothetical protein [Clostridium perfringens]MDM0793843.1 hypothetical protein [Clostridium perfringens]MDU2156826.1 hypothetical protein [Clostridium sp.]